MRVNFPLGPATSYEHRPTITYDSAQTLPYDPAQILPYDPEDGPEKNALLFLSPHGPKVIFNVFRYCEIAKNKQGFILPTKNLRSIFFG